VGVLVLALLECECDWCARVGLGAMVELEFELDILDRVFPFGLEVFFFLVCLFYGVRDAGSC